MTHLDLAKISAARKRLFSSQREAGEAAGFPRAVAAQRWADIESGRIANITLGTLARIAKALDEKPGDLLKP